MFLRGLFDKTTFILEKALDVRLKEHNAIASNIANIDTPHYRPKKISFERELKNALSAKTYLKTTNPRHFSVGKINYGTETVFNEGLDDRPRGLDTSDIDKQMAALAKNHLMYIITIQMLKKKFNCLKNVITQGGK